jgi:hypothetical protein
MGPFLRWWFGKGEQRVAGYDREPAERMVLQNTRLKMALRRFKRELVPSEDVTQLRLAVGEPPVGCSSRPAGTPGVSKVLCA